MAGFEVRKILSGMLQEKEGPSKDAGVKTPESKQSPDQSEEVAAKLEAIRRNTTADDQSSLAHQDKMQHNELVRILKKGFNLDEFAATKDPNDNANKGSDSGGLLSSGLVDNIGSFLMGSVAFKAAKKLGSVLNKALKLSFKGITKIPGVGKMIASAGALFTGGSLSLGKAGKLLGKLAWPIAALSAVFDGWKGWDAEKAKELFGSDSVSAKIGSSISHIVSGLLLDLVSPEQVANGMKQIANLGEDIGNFFMGYVDKIVDGAKELLGGATMENIADTIASPINWMVEQAQSIGDWIEQKASEWTPDWVKSGWSATKDFFMGKEVAAATLPTVVPPPAQPRATAFPQVEPISAPVASAVPSGPVPTVSVPSAAPAPAPAPSHRPSAGGGPTTLADAIAAHESKGDYNVFNRGAGNKYKIGRQDFSGMTLDEVMKQQNLASRDPNRLFAVGKYQIIPETLASAKKAMKLKGDEKFTPELQDRIFSEYLAASKRPQLEKFIRSGTGLEAAKLAGAQEWASIGVKSKGDRSYYAGDGINKAYMSSGEFETHLQNARQIYLKAKQSGVSDEEAMRMAMLGENRGAQISNVASQGSVSQPVARAGAGKASASSPEFTAPSVPVPATLAPEQVAQAHGGTSPGPGGASAAAVGAELSLASIPAVPNDERLALINLGLA